MKAVIFIIACILTSTVAQYNYGTEFYFGGIKNYAGITEDFLLYILTPSSSPVSYTVETSTTVLYTGTVTNTLLAKLSLSTSLIVLNNNYSNRNKGIRVSSTNGGLLSVIVINRQVRATATFLPYSVDDFKLNEYRYYAVSTGTLVSNSHGQALLVGIHDNTTVTIVPTQNIQIPQDIQDPSSSNMTVTAGTSVTVLLHKMQTLYFGANMLDISGTSIVSNKPLTVLTGHECGNIPANIRYCEHMTLQIPPTEVWGTEYLLASYGSLIKSQFYKIIAAEKLTTFYYTCGQGNVSVHVLQNAGNVLELAAGENDTCSIVSDKPILVVKLSSAYLINLIGDPTMTVVPPTTLYSYNAVYVSLTDDLFINSGRTFSSHTIDIVSKHSAINIIKDGTQLALTWTPIYDRDSIIGYNTQMQNGTLDVSHYIESNGTMGVLVYGFHYRSGYTYYAGVRDSCLDQNGRCEQLCNAGICSCMTGYTLDSNNGRNCTDIDECQINNGNCEHNCTNLSPSYSCTCLPNFALYNQYFCKAQFSSSVIASSSIPTALLVAIGIIFIIAALCLQIVTCLCCACFVIGKRKKREEDDETKIIVPIALKTRRQIND